MTIKIGIAASRADIVESALRNFTFTKSEKVDGYGCYLFTIECSEIQLSNLCLNLFHAGVDAGERIFKS
jgi:hypothetical protein